jgi:hypothetical protein
MISTFLFTSSFSSFPNTGFASFLAGTLGPSAEAAEAECRGEAKAQATRIYRACMRKTQSQRLNQLKEDYQNRLRQLQQEYEKELKNLSEQSQSLRLNETRSNETKNSRRSSDRGQQKPVNSRNTVAGVGALSHQINPPKVNSMDQIQMSRLESEFEMFDQAQDMDLPEPIPVENVPLIGR